MLTIRAGVCWEAKVPEGPFLLNFDPKNPVTRSIGFDKVFRNLIAWPIFLLFWSAPLVNGKFESWCLKVASEIEKLTKPVTAGDLFTVITKNQLEPSTLFLTGKIEGNLEVLNALAQAINHPKTFGFRYEVVTEETV
jgi:hypothetical protein